MKHAYSPHTGELIITDTPADWMGVTDIAPPTFDASIAGCFFRDGAWVVEVSVPDTTQQAAEARRQRNALISQSDWTQLPDAPLTSAQRGAWVTYRQALRDISKQTAFPTDIAWPVMP